MSKWNRDNYNKLLNVKEIDFEYLDKDTLINWEVVELWRKEIDLDDREWICIEVWLDEDNEIKILQSSDGETEEISEYLTYEQLNHVHTIVEKAIKKLMQNKLNK